MTKQSIFGRIAQLTRANINALLDSAEDPQKMLDQMVRDFTNSIADAESAIADELRTAGNAVDADKFDNLAKVALGRQLASEKEAKDAEPQIASQSAIVEQLKTGLNTMKTKLNQLTAKRSELIARSKTAAAQSQVMDAVKSIDILDPTSEVSRFEDKIRREEAKVRGASELAASSLDAQFESLDDLGELTEVDARLAALKAGSTTSSIEQ
jgi:phage shock protein A